MCRRTGTGPEQSAGAPVEPRHLAQHPEVRRTGQVAGGREEATGTARPGVLQPGRLVAHGHRHLRRLRGDADLREQPQQRRVGAFVVHDEASVDREPADVVRVRVAAQACVCLVERHVGGPGGDVRGGETGDAGPDHRDPAATGRSVGHAASFPRSAAFNGKRATGPGGRGLRPARGLDADRGGHVRWRGPR